MIQSYLVSAYNVTVCTPSPLKFFRVCITPLWLLPPQKVLGPHVWIQYVIWWLGFHSNLNCYISLQTNKLSFLLKNHHDVQVLQEQLLQLFIVAKSQSGIFLGTCNKVLKNQKTGKECWLKNFGLAFSNGIHIAQK